MNRLKVILSLLALFHSLSVFPEDTATDGGVVTISIMKFKTITDAQDTFWGESCSEALSTKLAGLKSIRLYERAQFEKIYSELKLGTGNAALFDEKTVAKVGKIVAVDYLLIGSVTKVGDKINTGIRLIEVKTSKTVLSRELEGVISDLFDMQDTIAFLVTDALNLRLSELEKKQITKNGRISLDAFDLYNQSLMAASDEEIIPLLIEAIGKEPDFKQAQYLLADAYYRSGNIPEARNTLELVLKREPNNTRALYNLSLLYIDLNLFDLAEQTLKKSLKADPLSPDAYYHLAYIKEFNKQFERYGAGSDLKAAYALYEKALKINPNHIEAVFCKGILAAQLAQQEGKNPAKQKLLIEEAVRCFERYLTVNPNAENGEEVKLNIDLLKDFLIQVNTPIKK